MSKEALSLENKIKKREALEVDYPTKFIELAGEIKTLMPYYVVTKIFDALP